MNVVTGKLTITDFFNPYDSDHLTAYRHLMQHGAWPEGFLPKGIEFSPVWQAEIENELAQAWLKHCTVERPEGLLSEASIRHRKLPQDELAEDLYQALIDVYNRIADQFLTGTASEWSPDFRAVRAEIMSTLYNLRIQADTVRAAHRRHLPEEEKQT